MLIFVLKGLSRKKKKNETKLLEMVLKLLRNHYKSSFTKLALIRKFYMI